MKDKLIVAVVALVAGAIGGGVLGQMPGLSAASTAPETSGATLIPVQPQQRALDTREPGDITGGNPLTEEQTIQLKMAGEHGVPASAAAVQLNVTVVDGNTPSFLTVWDEGDNPGTSSLNWTDGQARPNAVTTAIGSDGFVRIFNRFGVVNVVVDVVGYYSSDGVVSDFEVVSESFDIDMSAEGDITGNSVRCPEGKLVTGGGASALFDGEPPTFDMKTSIPQRDLTGWEATVVAESGSFDGRLNIYAICASGVVLATP